MKCNFNDRIGLVVELDRIADQVSEQDLQLRLISVDGGERIRDDQPDFLLANCEFHVRLDLIDHGRHRDFAKGFHRPAHPGER